MTLSAKPARRRAMIAGALALPLLAACVATAVPPVTPPTEPVFGTYFLTSVNGRPVAGNAHIRLLEDGTFSGAAPCNLYNGTNTAPLPAFSATNVVSTRRACLNPEDNRAEAEFFAALRSVTRASFPYRRLSLSGPGGAQLDFTLE